jgi:signal transduction histidine kinase
MAILLTCWLALLIGGAGTYVAIRRAVLEDLDASLVLRASSLPEVLGVNPNAAKGEQLVLPPGDRYILKDAVGHTLARPGPDSSKQARRAEVRGARFATLADGTRVRSVTLVFPATMPGGEGEMTVVYSRSAEHFDQLLARMWLVFAIAGPACGLLTALVAIGVARRALRPLTAAAATITSIDERTLDRRLEPKTLPPELRPMAERLNQMLTRLEDGMRQRKQFMADAAHELRTPVSAMLTSMEVAMRRPARDVASLTQTMNDCIGDARVLRRLVTALLDQFKTDATASSTLHEVDVSSVLDLCADSLESSARQHQVALRRMYRAGLRFNTQPDRFRSIAANLMDNALEYNVPGGWVEVTCELGNNGLTLTVSDCGKGISETRLPHVFEPFYHGEKDRPVESGHCGLGLFLVKSHVDALGGILEVRSTAGTGSTFTARLPVMAAATAPGPGRSVENVRNIDREIQHETSAAVSLSSNGAGTNFQVKC